MRLSEDEPDSADKRLTLLHLSAICVHLRLTSFGKLPSLTIGLLTLRDLTAHLELL
jgi:hypothetical protein